MPKKTASLNTPVHGANVRITTTDDVIEGILLPRPAILRPGITVIKLKSGYNIGIEDKKIRSVETIEPPKRKEQTFPPAKHNPTLPTVAILSTGGTISARVDYRTGGTLPATYSAEELFALCPELSSIANITTKSIMAKATEDFTPNDWKTIATATADALNTADGVVVTLGTDTFHYATAALSFMLPDAPKPVVLTAAQRSVDRGSSDAFMNLVCAVTAAAHWEGAEVVSCMHASTNDDYCILIRGTKVRKMHTSRRDAFRPVNTLPLAKVETNGTITTLSPALRARGNNKATATTAMEERVALIFIYPNMDPGVIDWYVERGFKGIILAATALGHVPTNGERSLLPAIERAHKNGVAVIIASQTLYGRVHPYVYTNLRMLSIKLNCIFVDDMLPEVAYVKLMHVLPTCKDLNDVRTKMQTPIAGEISERELPEEFLA